MLIKRRIYGRIVVNSVSSIKVELKNRRRWTSHGFDVLPTRISRLPLFILTLRDLGLKKEGSSLYETIDIASPHEQMSNSTVTISTTFFQSLYSWNNEDIHSTQFTAEHWPPKWQPSHFISFKEPLGWLFRVNSSGIWFSNSWWIDYLKPCWQLLSGIWYQFFYLLFLSTISFNDMLKSPLVI